jgi:hypothetical protein
MPSIAAAWLVGNGIIAWRSVKQGRPPVPGQLIAANGVFIILAVVASTSAAPVAGLMAWGFDIAALMNVLPDIAVGGTKAETTAATQEGAA